jgi:putative ABC transport system permease protein
MSWLDGIAHRLRTLLHPGRHASELEDEVRLHLELDAVHEGDAGQTRRRFGSPLYHREETRAQTWLRLVDVAGQDLRAAWRGVTHRPAVAALVVGTLALGIGANAATFTILDALYLRAPGGLAEPDSLRRYWLEHFAIGDSPHLSQNMPHPAYQVLARASGNAERMALFATDNSLRLGRGFGGPRVRVVYASASYFPVLGVALARGRFYTSAEDSLGNGAPVALVSHAFWKSRLGGDPAAIGKTIAIGKTDYTVLGVFDPSFRGLDLEPSDVWIPHALTPETGRWWERVWNTRPFRVVELGGQPAAVVSQRATAMIRAFNRETRPERPDTLMNVHLSSIVRGPAKPGQELIITTRLAGVAAMVLLIAWANVINLLLARAVDRRKEIAVRLALGVSRMRLIRTLMLEAGVLALAAAAVALLAGWAGGLALRALLTPGVEWAYPAFDQRIALFTGLVALTSGFVAGLLPAVQASQPVLTSALKSGARNSGRHRSRLRTGLVAVQTALSVTLLVGAALFVQSLRNVRALDIGFDPDRLVFASIGFLEGEAPPTPVLVAALRNAASRLASRPGVEVVARAGMEPMRGFGVKQFFADEFELVSFSSSDPGTPFSASVTPSYFEAVGLRFLRGRSMAGGDVDRGPAEVVVNETMARLVWPGRDPVGRCMRFWKRENPCYTVVGVVEDARWGYVIEPEPKPQYYLPLGNLPDEEPSEGVVVVRAEAGAASQVASEVRKVLADAFPAGDVHARRMIENLEPEYRPWRLGALLFTSFGFLALLVALIGIYSTVSYGVSQRTHEFGVRTALGAQLADVVRLVVCEGLRTVAIGVVLGIALALAAGRLISSMLYGIKPGEPLVLLLVSTALLAVAAMAALLPAWRAGRIDPMMALRAE